MLYSLQDLQHIPFPLFNSKEACLFVYESGKHVPFHVQRIFVINAKETCNRGFHAHKECTQLLIVLNGECKVTCDDGTTRKDIILNKSSEGLLIPPTLWAEQEYQPDTILMVLTDQPFDENDYIRNYDEFLSFRKKI